jgi:hypothetical protein
LHQQPFGTKQHLKLKTELIQIFDCSSSKKHFSETSSQEQFVKFLHFYQAFLENEKRFYNPDGSLQKIEKYYFHYKHNTVTYSFDYAYEGEKEIVTIRNNGIVDEKVIKDPKNDIGIREEYHDGWLRTRIFSVLSSGQDTRAIQYNKDGEVIFDHGSDQVGQGKSDYKKEFLKNGGTRVSYRDGNSQIEEVYNSSGEEIAYSSSDIYDNLDDLIRHNAGRIGKVKPIQNVSSQGNFNFFGVERQIMEDGIIETQTSYVQYNRNNIVYRSPEEIVIRIYNSHGDIVEEIDEHRDKERYIYNENNQLMELKKISAKGELMMKVNFSYKNDLLTKIKVLDGPEGQGVMQLDLDYTFDSRGNWTKMTYSENGTCKHVKMRTLTYY